MIIKISLRSALLFFLLFLSNSIYSTSEVYNFRIAQITKQPIIERPYDSAHHTLIALLFDQYLKKYTGGIHENFVGGLGSYIYNFYSYYARADFAVSHIKQTTAGITTFSGTQTDDILFTVGRNFKLNNHRTLTFSGLFGIPTHRIFTLEHVEFGYGQIGMGLQVDGVQMLNEKDGLIYGLRYLYFVPRTALDDMDNKYRFTIGTIVDLLGSYKHDWLNRGIEFGYTARFQCGAHVSPAFDAITQKSNYIRSNFYAVYKYKFSVNEVHNRLLFYIAYGFDHNPKLYGNKYIVTLWTSWNVNF